MLKGFRDFILRGNVVDLAVAIVMGTAFNDVVKSMVENVITPLIGLVGGHHDFSAISLGPVMVGKLINALLSFFILATVVYFGLVIPMNQLLTRFNPPPPPPEPKQKCPECLSEIPVAARRCSYCTSLVATAA